MYKKFFIGSAVFLIIAFFLLFNVYSVSAAECGQKPSGFSFSKFLNPLAFLAEKVVKGFGYEIALAEIPDPDNCGSDSVVCSCNTPTAATINWVAAPFSFSYYLLVVFNGTWTACASEGGFCSFSGTKIVRYGTNGVYTYQVFTGGATCTTVNFGGPFNCDPYPGVSKSCSYSTGPGVYNTSASASYAIFSGLGNNTTYSWLVEAYQAGYFCSPSVYSAYTNQPYGSFTTSCKPTCAPSSACFF